MDEKDLKRLIESRYDSVRAFAVVKTYIKFTLTAPFFIAHRRHRKTAHLNG